MATASASARVPLILANGDWRLEFDGASGRWREWSAVVDGRRILHGGARRATLTFRVGGFYAATSGRSQPWSLTDADTIGLHAAFLGARSDEDGGIPRLRLSFAEGDWRWDEWFALVPCRDPDDGAAYTRLERGFRIAYDGPDEARLRDVEMRMPPGWVDRREPPLIEAPCQPVAPGQPLHALPLGQDWAAFEAGVHAAGWEPGVIGWHGGADDHAVLVWPFDEVEPVLTRVRRESDGIAVVHAPMLSARLRRGDAVEATPQFAVAGPGGWHRALGRRRQWLDAGGWRAPSPAPWTRGAHIYETFIGHSRGRPASHPTMAALAEDLPRIRALGFDVVQVMPRLPFPSYAVHDYDDVDRQYGAGLGAMVGRAHAIGLKVILDVVIHGVMDRELYTGSGAEPSGEAATLLAQRHPYRVAHPEWFMEADDGQPGRASSWAFDHAHRGWQDFLIGVLERYLRGCDVDGFRMDALAWNSFPNWGGGLAHRASASLYGARELSERARAALISIKPEVVLYTETTHPVYARSYDWIYNYDAQWIFSALMHPIAPQGYAWLFALPRERLPARHLGAWLDQRRRCLPAGIATVHHLDSHDTHEWGGLMQFRREAFGVAAAQALFAICCALDGGVMLFAGAEAGQEEAYRRLLTLRRDCPALRQGEAIHDGVSASHDRVFAVLRRHGDQVVLAVINCGAEPISASVHLLPQLLPDGQGGRVRDLLVWDAPWRVSGDRTQVRVDVPLAGYGYRFLDLLTVDRGIDPRVLR